MPTGAGLCYQGRERRLCDDGVARVGRKAGGVLAGAWERSPEHMFQELCNVFLAISA